MRVILLGTGGYHPTEQRETACLMIPERGVILDAGTSSYRIPDRIEKQDLNIFLSHAHLDHVIGLTYLLVPFAQKQITSANVFGTKKTIEAVQHHLFSQELFPVLPPYEFFELKEETSLAGGGTLTTIEQEHPGASLGFKLAWPDCQLAYLTDTFSNKSQQEFISGVDLLVHECNFPEGYEEWAKKTGHSTPTPVAEMARDADVGRLILTHFDPLLQDDPPFSLEQVRNIFPNTELAYDLMEIEL